MIPHEVVPTLNLNNADGAPLRNFLNVKISPFIISCVLLSGISFAFAKVRVSERNLTQGEPVTGSTTAPSVKNAFPPNGPFPPSEKYTTQADLHFFMIPGFKLERKGKDLIISADTEGKTGFTCVNVKLVGSRFEWLKGSSRPTYHNVIYLLPIRLPASKPVNSIPMTTAYFQDPDKKEWIEITPADPILFQHNDSTGMEVEIHVRLPLPSAYHNYGFNVYGTTKIKTSSVYTSNEKNTGINMDTVKSMMAPQKLSRIKFKP